MSNPIDAARAERRAKARTELEILAAAIELARQDGDFDPVNHDCPSFSDMSSLRQQGALDRARRILAAADAAEEGR